MMMMMIIIMIMMIRLREYVINVAHLLQKHPLIYQQF